MPCTTWIITPDDCDISYLLEYMYYSFNLEKIQYIYGLFFQLNECSFHFKVFWWYFNTFNRPKSPNIPILNYIDHITTINQLTYKHFFHYQYLPTCWCSLESSWASLWLWRTCLAASLILCRSSSSSSSGSK